MSRYQVGHELIEVHTDDLWATAFLAAFLDRGHPAEAARPALAAITIGDDLLGPDSTVHGTVAIQRDGQQYRIGRRSAAVPLDRGEALGVLRKLIRVIWLTSQAPEGDYFYLHASAVDDGRTLIVFTGDKRGGKTTLMLDAVCRHGFSLITNDGLLISRSGDDLLLSPMPTLAKIRGDAAERFLPCLTGRVTDPYNSELLRSWQQAGSPAVDESPLYLTFGVLGRRFHSLRLAQRRVLVAGVQFAPRGQAATLTPLPSATGARALVAANRKEFIPTFGELVGYVPSTAERESRLLAEISPRLEALRFVHVGEAALTVARSAMTQ